MTELIKKAIEKIDAEAEKLDSTSAKVIASYIIDNYLKNDINAEKILDEKKTLSDCFKSIKNKAQAQAKSGMAMVSDTVVYTWAVEYYGLIGVQQKRNVVDIMDFI